MQFDPVGHTFGFGVRQGRFNAVAGLVQPPNVHAYSTSPRQQLGRGQQNRATSAAKVEHAFIAAQA
jgi:hypothetical protein